VKLFELGGKLDRGRIVATVAVGGRAEKGPRGHPPNVLHLKAQSPSRSEKPMIATLRRLTPDDREVLAAARRDHVLRVRPGQLEARLRLIAALAPAPAAAKQAELEQAEVAKARREVDNARAALERALQNVDDLTRPARGRWHGAQQLDGDIRRQLRELAHPVIERVVRALTRAHLDACAIRPVLEGIDQIDTEVAPAQTRWFDRPFFRRTEVPVFSTGKLEAFVAAIRGARATVEDLAYQRLDDDVVVARLRAEIDAVLTMPVPSGALHVREDLAALRRMLIRDAIDLYDEEPAPWWGAEGVSA
jgi:hypothetical protein